MRVPLLLALMLVAACETTQSLAPTAGQATTIDVHPGDVVRVLTKDTKRVTFEVTLVEQDALAGTTRKIAKGDPVVEGQPARVAYTEIAFIERHREWSAGRTSGAVVGTIAVITLIGAAVSSVAFLPAAVPVL